LKGARGLWLILALALLVTLIFLPSAAVYWHEWLDFRNITFTHGLLILAVCVALVMRAAPQIAAAPLQTWPLALGALALCVFAWLVCYRASIQDLHVTIFPAIFWLAVAAACGRDIALVLAFPVAFFYFAVPSWAQLGGPLQELTVHAVHAMLWLTGPQVTISGDLVRIPNGSFVIEEGCSGLHFMIVGLAVAALHGELRRDPWKVRIVQLALMTVLALLANWVRVYSIIEAGYLTNMRSYLVSVSHYWFGWGVFAVALVLFFWLTTRLAPSVPEPAPAQPAVTAAAPRSGLAGFAYTVLILGALPGASWLLRAVQPAAPLTPALAPAAPSSWSSVSSDIASSWQPTFPGADREQRLAYNDGAGDTVEVYTVSYRGERQGAKLIGMGTSLIGDRLVLRAEAVVPSAAGRFREAQVAERRGTRSLIWSRFEMAGGKFVVPLYAQLWYGLVATVSNPPAALVAYRAACGVHGECEDARRVLAQFAVSGSSG
jgi:EpsI family protein